RYLHTFPTRRSSDLPPPMTRAKADELRKGGLFDEAAPEYAAIWPDGDKWTGWGYAFCLRKLGRSQDALRVAREVHMLDPAFPMRSEEHTSELQSPDH